MKVKIQNQEYLISFPEITDYMHSSLNTEDAPISSDRGISCNIRFARDKKLMSRGKSFCHWKDRFIRTVGEKKALARAMESMGWNKEERTLVWNTYLHSSRKRRKLINAQKVEEQELEPQV